MKLTELYQRLSYGELSNLAVGGEGSGAVTEAMKPRLINYANEGLLRLHSKFMLRENVVFVRQVPNLTYYYLMLRYAVSRSALPADPECPAPPHFYIVDTEAEPFQEDVIKVLSVFNQEGIELPLNDSEDPRSIFTPQPNLLQVPAPVAEQMLAVSYQARHPIIVGETECQEIDLPFSLEGALTAYIAYKVFSHMNGQDNAAKASEHLSMYDMICGEVTDQDLVSQSSSTTNTKFEQRGFV